MIDIKDPKPSLEVVDPKPNLEVIDRKPAIDPEKQGLELQLFEVVLGAGMATGVPGHTYPEAITITSPKTA